MISKEEFKLVRCASCGFHFTNPIPAESIIGTYYQSEDYVSHSSSKKGLINRVYNLVRNHTLKRKVKLVSRVSKGIKLLDFGAGTGHFLNQAKLNGFEVLGLEPDDQARSFAKANFSIELKSTETLVDLEKESFSVITMWHVLEHVYHLQRDFKLLVDLLEKSGVLIIAVPNMSSYDAKHYAEFWAAYDVPRHLYHFRKKDIDFLARQFGMKVAEVLPMKFDSYYVSMLSEKYKGGSIFKAMWIGFLSNFKSKSGGYSSQIYILKKQN